jgi:hypothetical protein
MGTYEMNALASKLYKRTINFSLAFVVATSSLTAIGAFLAPTAGALPPTGTITVQGDTAAAENTEGWMFNRDVTTSTPFEFNADEADLGLGSLYVAPISGSVASDKFIAENFLLSEIDDVNTISYDYMIGANGVSSDYDQMYMNVYANFGESSATKFYDCRYTVLASSASTSSFTTLTFDTNSAYLVATRTGGQASPYTCPTVPSAMNSLSAGSTIRAFSINVGDTTLGDANIDAYLDNVVVNSVSGITTYDFEPVVPACEAGDNTNFETFSTGTVNGQSGWESTGPFDQAVVTNDYDIEGFGCQSLRISNAVTSGNFDNQTFSYSTANEAGETESTNGGKSGGTRQNRFEAAFDIASTQSAVQTGMSMSVSPDRGDGSRMSYLRFVDGVNGIEVYFSDVQEGEFTDVYLGSLDRSVPHNIRFVIDYVDGPSNDVVNILIDGTVVHTGTSWEDYYRFDPESAAEQSPRTSDSLIFLTAGTAVPANVGKGFLIDNVVIATNGSPVVVPEQPTTGGSTGNGSDSGGSPITTAATTNTPIITNPASVLGATDNTDTEGESDVEGTTDDKTATTEKNTDGVILGLMWYWWILILAGAAGLTWWIIAAYRRRNTEE